MSRIEDGGAVEAGLEKTDQLFNPLRDRNERWLMLLRHDWVKVKVGDVQDALQGADILTEYTSALRAEITRLRAENAGMREALERFGALAENYEGRPLSDWVGYRGAVYVSDLRRARAALSKASQAEGQTR